MKLSISILTVTVLLLFTPGAWSASYKEENVSKTQDAFYDCQISAIQTLDDGQSDTRSVALALTNYCEIQYVAMNKALAQYNIANQNERRMFMIDKNSNPIKIEASLPVVLSHRQGN